MARKYANWIDAFVEHTEDIKSPEHFRRWAAISAISSSLQRRVWMRFGGQSLYVNFYVLLIGPPGTGKSNAIKFARNIIRRLQNIKLTPTRITGPALYMELDSAKSTQIDTAKQR